MAWRHPAISASGRFGTLTLTTTGSSSGAARTAADDLAGHGGRGVPALVGDHLVPALALDAEPGDGLADGDAADPAVAGRQGGPDGAGVVDRPPDVGARVDAGHDEVDRPEHAEPGEHHAQPGRPGDRPRLVDPVDRWPGAPRAGSRAARRATRRRRSTRCRARRPRRRRGPASPGPARGGRRSRCRRRSSAAVGARRRTYRGGATSGSCRSARTGGRSRAPAWP